MRKINCILFDIDGTVLDTEEQNVVPLQKLYHEEFGKTITLEELYKYTGVPGLDTIEKLGFKNINESYAKWVKYVNEYEKKAELFPGIMHTIIELDKLGIICGVVTSKMKKQYSIDVPSKFSDYMEVEIKAEDTENHKPYPDPILKALEKLDFEPSETLYIGDTHTDSLSAQAAGVNFGIAVWGARNLHTLEYFQYSFEKPEQILEIFSKKNT